MKVVIQHNWTTGLGDLYCACTEYLKFIKPLKEIGYETKLIFSFNGISGSNKYIGINEFDKIFDISSFHLFDDISIRKYPVTDLNYDDTHYHHTQYGPTSPGHHWWDVFFDVIPNNLRYPNINPQTFLDKKETISVLPLFNEQIYKRSSSFQKKINDEYDFIQIRYFDYSNKITEEFDKDMNQLFEIVKKSQRYYHIGSNSPYVMDKFLELDNVITYKFNNLDLFSNDHSYYLYNKHISNDILLDRLYDNIAEMVSISNAKNIFHYSTFDWISNFLLYGFIFRGDNLSFKKINNNISSLNGFNN